MRPTFSILVFTVLSGAGYGVWFLAGLGVAVLWPWCDPQAALGGAVAPASCPRPATTVLALTSGFVLVTAGLLSSLGHLGQPQRAWRALSQWHSSWLSREGVASLLTYLPVIMLLAAIGWPRAAAMPGGLRALGALLVIGCTATVVCTANIYASLKPIRAWHNRWVVPGYLLLSLYGGALCLAALATLPGAGPAWDTAALPLGLVGLAAAAALLKSAYWRQIDGAPLTSAGHATGLEDLGRVRSFEQPHTEENYLTHEMGFVLARKHARKLRAIALVAAFLLPGLLAVLGWTLPGVRSAAAWLAFLTGTAGIFVERWLFFAEAKHAVMAYYDR